MSKIVDSLGAALHYFRNKKEVRGESLVDSTEVETTLFAVPAKCLDRSAVLLAQYPELGDLLENCFVSEPYVPSEGKFQQETFQCASGRSASLKDKEYVLDLQLLGMTEESLQATFYPDIKGVGTLDIFLEETLRESRPDLSEQERAKLVAELAPQLLITWKTMGHDRPFGSQIAYLEKHSDQIDYLLREGFHIKVTPYVGTLALPLGVMRRIVEVSQKLGVERRIGKRHSLREDASPEDFTFVQEVRLLPGDTRGHEITNANEADRKEIVKKLAISPEEFSSFVDRLLVDAAKYIQLFPQGLREVDDKLQYVGISDLMSTFQTKERFTKTVEPTIMLLKDIVISKAGIFYVDWESVDIHSEVSAETVDRLLEAYTVGFMSELTRVISQLVITYQELSNKQLLADKKSEIEQTVFKSIVSKLDPKLAKATFSGQNINFEFYLLGEWKKYSLSKSDFPWQFS